METEVSQEVWQVEANGNTFDVPFDEMTTWIDEGSLLRIDRVRKGNLRWIEAGKVPALIEFFNAKDDREPPAPVITTTKKETLGVPFPTQDPSPSIQAPKVSGDNCAVHIDAPARYSCDTCFSLFCRACPTSYGSTVKICPFCGAMCSPLDSGVAETSRVTRTVSANGATFGFEDFGKAIAFPFRHKFSLFAGAIMFALFSLGQSAGAFGGMFMMFSVIICFMMANMLTFGVLANTVENFSQGKLDENFMPSFDDFNIWEDVVHPFFLSIAAYLASFGPFIAVAAIAFFLVVGNVTKELDAAKTDAARAVNPSLVLAANAAEQSQKVRELVNKASANQQQRVLAAETGQNVPDDANTTSPYVLDEEAQFQETNKMITDYRKAQLEGAIGKSPDTVAAEQQAMMQGLLSKGIVILLLLAAAGLWGLFYFPAACAVAGYTRSFMATINPLVGLDTIKRLGSTYFLILVMSIVLLFVSSLVSGILSAAFSAFDLPSVGNIPAKFLGAMFGFYITVVFSCILGYALFKKADKLDLPS